MTGGRRPPTLVWAAVTVALAVPLYVGLWLLGGPCPLLSYINGACATPDKATLASIAYSGAAVFAAAWPAWWLCLWAMRLIEGIRR